MGLKKEEPITTARPDERGRITLGSALTKNISRFDVYLNEETGEVLLKPFREVPANEAWFYKNEDAQKLVAKGLVAVKASKLKKVDLKKSSWIDDVLED